MTHRTQPLQPTPGTPWWHVPVLDFFKDNKSEFSNETICQLTGIAVESIENDHAVIDCAKCPAHLRAQFVRAIVEGAYRFRSKDVKFKIQKTYLP